MIGVILDTSQQRRDSLRICNKLTIEVVKCVVKKFQSLYRNLKADLIWSQIFQISGQKVSWLTRNDLDSVINYKTQDTLSPWRENWFRSDLSWAFLWLLKGYFWSWSLHSIKMLRTMRSCLDSHRQTVGEVSKGSTSNVDANTVPLLFGAEDSLKCCFPSC